MFWGKYEAKATAVRPVKAGQVYDARTLSAVRTQAHHGLSLAPYVRQLICAAGPILPLCEPLRLLSSALVPQLREAPGLDAFVVW